MDFLVLYTSVWTQVFHFYKLPCSRPVHCHGFRDICVKQQWDLWQPRSPRHRWAQPRDSPIKSVALNSTQHLSEGAAQLLILHLCQSSGGRPSL